MLGRNQGVIWPTPGYPIYGRGARLAGAAGRPVRLGRRLRVQGGRCPRRGVEERRPGVDQLAPQSGRFGDEPRRQSRASTASAGSSRSCCAPTSATWISTRVIDRSSVLEVAGAELSGVVSYLSLSKRSGMTGYRSAAMVGDARAIGALASLRHLHRDGPARVHPDGGRGGLVRRPTTWSERRRIFARKRAILRARLRRNRVTGSWRRTPVCTCGWRWRTTWR